MKGNVIPFRRDVVAKMSYMKLKYQLFIIIRSSIWNFHLLNQDPKTFETFALTVSIMNNVLGTVIMKNALSGCVEKVISTGCAV